MAKYEEKALVVRLKDSYTLLSNSYRLTLQQDGPPGEWGLNNYAAWSAEATDLALKQFTKHLKVNKWCKYPNPDVQDCFATSLYKSIGGAPSRSMTNVQAVQLRNGASLTVAMNDPTCNINNRGDSNMCGELKIDINGPTGPNVMGKDLHHFVITATGIVPHDFRRQQWYSDCNAFKKTTDGYNGWGCTGWALAKGNFDYLRCSTDTLKTKGTCK